MAVKNYQAKQLADDYRKRPTEDHGKLRIQFFDVVVGAADGGDANSTIDLCDLPPGAVRLLPNLSRISTSALGAGVTLSLGHRAYAARPPAQDVDIVEDLDAFTEGANLNVAAATNVLAVSTKLKFDLYSIAGVRAAGQFLGGVVPNGATVSGFLVYVYE